MKYAISFGPPTYNADAIISSENQFNDAPGAGMQYLLVTVTLKNTGTTVVDASLETYSGISIVINGSAYSRPGSLVLPNNMLHIDAVPQGTSVTGNLAFEVPTGTLGGTWALTAGNPSWFITAG